MSLRKGGRVGAIALGGIILASASSAEETYNINVILPLSGPGAFVGQSSQKALGVLETVINADGGINGTPIKFVVHDDQSNPQVAVQLTTKILPSKPALLIGPAISAACRSVAPLVTKGPVAYCLSPAIRPDPGSYMFTATADSRGLVGTMLRYFKARGLTRLAMLATNDASGRDLEDAFDQVTKEPDLDGIELLERVEYQPTEITLSAQVERILAAKPQALLVYGTGTAMGSALRSLRQAGVDLPTGSSTFNMNYAFMRQYVTLLPKDLYFAANEGTANGEGLTLDPRTEAAKKKYDAAFAAIGEPTDTGTEIVWDASLIAIAALKNAGPAPTAERVRDYIAHLKNYAGISGVYDFDRVPQRGLDEHNPIVVRWSSEISKFVAVSQPGGREVITPTK